MKRKIILIALALVCLLVLAGCGCEHEWKDADCTTPKTCALCGETEGEALGHTWKDADCTTPKTCSVCGATEGAALGHTWTEADCENPKTCSVCGETEGEALGHVWADATTEAPKTCTVCGATEGERIITDSRFSTAAATPVLGAWKGVMTVTGEDMGLEDFDGTLDMYIIFTFGPDGTLTFTEGPDNLEAYNAVVKDITMKALYEQFAAEGLNQDDADAAMKEAYNMTVEEYADFALSSVEESDYTYGFEMVYYVDGTQVCIGESWDGELEPSEFRLDGDKLYLSVDLTGDDTYEELELERVTMIED